MAENEWRKRRKRIVNARSSESITAERKRNLEIARAVKDKKAGKTKSFDSIFGDYETYSRNYNRPVSKVRRK